jgi:multiple sugar transport system substrate-binding protein
MFNSLADSIRAGIKNPAASLKWSSASPPPIARTSWRPGASCSLPSSSSEKAAEAFKAKGIDISAFTTHAKDGTTFLFTITENAENVAGLMGPAMDAVLTGKDASTLTETNEKVNALFK